MRSSALLLVLLLGVCQAAQFLGSTENGGQPVAGPDLRLGQASDPDPFANPNPFPNAVPPVVPNAKEATAMGGPNGVAGFDGVQPWQKDPFPVMNRQQEEPATYSPNLYFLELASSRKPRWAAPKKKQPIPRPGTRMVSGSKLNLAGCAGCYKWKENPEAQALPKRNYKLLMEQAKKARKQMKKRGFQVNLQDGNNSADGNNTKSVVIELVPPPVTPEAPKKPKAKLPSPKKNKKKDCGSISISLTLPGDAPPAADAKGAAGCKPGAAPAAGTPPAAAAPPAAPPAPAAAPTPSPAAPTPSPAAPAAAAAKAPAAPAPPQTIQIVLNKKGGKGKKAKKSKKSPSITGGKKKKTTIKIEVLKPTASAAGAAGAAGAAPAPAAAADKNPAGDSQKMFQEARAALAKLQAAVGKVEASNKLAAAQAKAAAKANADAAAKAAADAKAKAAAKNKAVKTVTTIGPNGQVSTTTSQV